ncbi:21752_t:CDS:1, partial [Racocetra persica]
IDTDTKSIQSDTTQIAELVEINNLLQEKNNELKLLIQLFEIIIAGLLSVEITEEELN